MEFLLIWTFISYGITSILVWGSIFEKFRNWIKKHFKFFGDLISCTLCTSTWVGFFMSIFFGSITAIFFDTNIVFHIFFDGMYSAGSVWALNSIIEFFEENRFNNGS
jgi:hypothetical protein